MATPLATEYPGATAPGYAVARTCASHGTVTSDSGSPENIDAKIEAKTAGYIQIFAERETGRLTGAVMVGPGVDHTAHLIAWSIQQGLTASKMLEMPFYHPTVEEGLKAALLEIVRQQIA